MRDVNFVSIRRGRRVAIVQLLRFGVYIIGLSGNDQLGNVRKNSKKHDLGYLSAGNVMCALALDVLGKYS